MPNRDFEAEMRRVLDAMTERAFYGAVTSDPAMTSSTVTETPPLTMDGLLRMVKDMDKVVRLNRRHAMRVIVDAGHEGSMLQHGGPAGQVTECSPLQAREIHREIPLRLVEVENEWRAVFEPALTIFNEWAPLEFQMPPWG